MPWETIQFGNSAPALSGGMSRRYAAGGLSVAKWLDRRKAEKTLRVLLVVNPTGDLDGAEDEGEAVLKMLTETAGVIVDRWSDAKPAKDGTLFVPEWAKT